MNYTIHKSDDFQKVKLPGVTAWISALRSGEYQQGAGKLCDSKGRYCCLGVLSKLQGRLLPVLTGGTEVMKDGGENGNRSYLHFENPLSSILDTNGFLPFVVCYLDGNTKQASYSLSFLNDSGLFTFDDIANILEEAFYE